MCIKIHAFVYYVNKYILQNDNGKLKMEKNSDN